MVKNIEGKNFEHRIKGYDPSVRIAPEIIFIVTQKSCRFFHISISLSSHLGYTAKRMKWQDIIEARETVGRTVNMRGEVYKILAAQIENNGIKHAKISPSGPK